METPAASTSESAAPVPRYVSQGRRAERAFGVVLEKERIDYWCKRVYERCYGEGSMSQLSRRQYNQFMSSLRGNVMDSLHHFVYKAFPNLPRLRRSVIILTPYPERLLFVFKDDSSPEAFNVKLNSDDVKGARELLGIRRPAQWYHVVVE